MQEWENLKAKIVYSIFLLKEIRQKRAIERLRKTLSGPNLVPLFFALFPFKFYSCKIRTKKSSF
jgi:hypothetical protein